MQYRRARNTWRDAAFNITEDYDEIERKYEEAKSFLCIDLDVEYGNFGEENE
jgi:hypothetical protein